MPTIFLSHTSIDKPFVEKLARDLQRLGISVWYDKYEIKVGESYLAADTDEWNPNRVSKSCYNTEIGSTINEVEEYIYQRVRQFVDVWGKPKGENHIFTDKKMKLETTLECIFEILKKTNWDQGVFETVLKREQDSGPEPE